MPAIPNGGFDNEGQGWRYYQQIDGALRERPFSDILRSGVVTLGGDVDLVQGIAADAIIPTFPLAGPIGAQPGDLVTARLSYDLNTATSDSQVLPYDALGLALGVDDPHVSDAVELRKFTNVDAFTYFGWHSFADPITYALACAALPVDKEAAFVGVWRQYSLRRV